MKLTVTIENREKRTLTVSLEEMKELLGKLKELQSQLKDLFDEDKPVMPSYPIPRTTPFEPITPPYIITTTDRIEGVRFNVDGVATTNSRKPVFCSERTNNPTIDD